MVTDAHLTLRRACVRCGGFKLGSSPLSRVRRFSGIDAAATMQRSEKVVGGDVGAHHPVNQHPQAEVSTSLV